MMRRKIIVPSPAATSVSALLGASVAPKWKANKLTARSPVGERTDIKLGKLSKILRNFVT